MHAYLHRPQRYGYIYIYIYKAFLLFFNMLFFLFGDHCKAYTNLSAVQYERNVESRDMLARMLATATIYDACATYAFSRASIEEQLITLALEVDWSSWQARPDRSSND